MKTNKQTFKTVLTAVRYKNKIKVDENLRTQHTVEEMRDRG